jgi:hypothetical protein
VAIAAWRRADDRERLGLGVKARLVLDALARAPSHPGSPSDSEVR